MICERKIVRWIVVCGIFGCFISASSDGHFENVALHKPSRMSSQYDSGHPPGWAVNGNTVGKFWNYTTGNDLNCVHTGPGDRNPWWEVDLGRPYPVYRITVWARYHDTLSAVHRMENAVITVDGQVCYRFPNSTEGWTEKREINCTKVLNGSVVRLAKHNETRGNFDYSINLCEFQVWSCRDGYWGSACDRVCGQCRDEVTCDKVTGQCDTGCHAMGFQPPLCTQVCPPHKQGEDCEDDCGACADNKTCDPKTGYCQGCAPTFSMPFCTDCIDGFWGQNCRQTCGHCDNGGACKRHSGNCWENCAPGWWGTGCNKTCPGHCGGDGACDMITGRCVHFCKPGWSDSPVCLIPCEAGRYGQNCADTCGHCRDSEPCDPQTGFCDHCEDGFEGHLCQKERLMTDVPAQESKENALAPTGLANPTNLAIMTTIIAVGVLVALCLLVLRCYRKSRRAVKKRPVILKCSESSSILVGCPDILSVHSGSEAQENVYNDLYDRFRWPGGAAVLWRASP